MTLTEFLLARIAEDESVSRSMDEHDAPFEREWEWCPRARCEPLGDLPGGPDAECQCNQPAIKRRALAECKAKRAIIGRARKFFDSSDEEFTLRALAAVYADHPDYRQEWAPVSERMTPRSVSLPA